MKKLLLALAFLFVPSFAWAQCNGTFGSNTFCGNAGSTSAPPTAFAGAPSGLTVSVDAFGAKGNGTTDDTAAINAAIASLPATGGSVNFTAGKTYCVSSTIVVGNGTPSGLSTINGIYLLGANGYGTIATGAATISGCFIYNTASPLVEFKGMKTWGISGLLLDCTDTSNGIGLEALDSSYGYSNSLTTFRCATHILIASDAAGNSQFNIFNNTLMTLFGGGSSFVGLKMSGDPTDGSNSSLNVFNSPGCNSDVAKANICFLLQDTDSNIFNTLNAAGIGNIINAAAIEFDYTTQVPGPASNVFNRFTFTNVNTNHAWINKGSPNQAPNYISYPDLTNNNVTPQLGGTEYTPGVWAPGVNLLAQTATVSATIVPSAVTIFPSGASRVCGYMAITTVGTSGATVSSTVTFTDANGAGSQTVSLTPTIATSGNNIGQSCVFMNVAGSTSISTTATVSGSMGPTAQYGLRAIFERLN